MPSHSTADGWAHQPAGSRHSHGREGHFLPIPTPWQGGNPRHKAAMTRGTMKRQTDAARLSRSFSPGDATPPRGRGYPRIKSRAAGPLVLTVNAPRKVFFKKVPMIDDFIPDGNLCAAYGCFEVRAVKGLCRKHYQRLREFGTINRIEVQGQCQRCHAWFKPKSKAASFCSKRCARVASWPSRPAAPETIHHLHRVP